MRKKHWTVMPWFLIFGIAMLFTAIATYSYNNILGYIEIGIAVVVITVTAVLSLRFRNYISGIVKSTVSALTGADYRFLEKYKYPVAVAGTKGDIVWCNVSFRKIICGGRSPEGDNIRSYLSNYDADELAEGEGKDIAVNGREFTVYCISSGGGYILHFIENTYYKSVVREHIASNPCVAVATFDNAEDFSDYEDEALSRITLAVESELQKWAQEYGALYKKTGNNRYLFVFREVDVEKICGLKFPVLKEIRQIRTNNRMATISVGLCRGAKTLKESEANARKALEMALGRGGDQVAVIKNNAYEFFGGKAAASEKLSKVRIRVIANAISRAVADCDKVYVMGHKFSDLDCVGAAVGMQCLIEKSLKHYCKIVIDKDTSMAGQLIKYVSRNTENDIFISPEEAARGVTQRSLLIIVDTHIKSSLESPEFYEKFKRVIIIDHHRKAVSYIDNALVFCHEPSASSASEMCSEIISCLDDKPLGYVQADALLAGIMLDTKNFVIKTGVRTFEAAAYLRKKGANSLTVREMFSDNIETYKEKAEIVCRASIYKNCAVSVSEKNTGDIRLAAAQAADEMLSLRGVYASFVIFENRGKINISARSYGRVNVQLIMEKLGGGGHQTMAAAQLDGEDFQLAYRKLIQAVDEQLEETSGT